MFDEIETSSGIYYFINNLNGKRYIGQAQNLNKRVKDHIRDLNGNRDYSKGLQNAWNKYGQDNFTISVIVFCSIEELDELEEYYIKELHSHVSENGYNIYWGGSVGKGDETLRRNKIENVCVS